MTETSAVVTGCSSGIGLAIAQRLLDDGYKVTGLDLRDPPPELSRADFAFTQGDVAEEAAVAATISTARNQAPLGVFVNNAALQLEKTLDETAVNEFDRLVAINVRGTFLGCKLAAAAMKDGGSIINLGSILGYTGDPLLAAYTITKGAVLNLTRTAALTYGRRGIRVNAICPGAVLTELTTRVWDLAPDPAQARREMESLYPLGRIVAPHEIAAIAAFLASDESSAITGAMIVADAGLTAANPELGLFEAPQ